MTLSEDYKVIRPQLIKAQKILLKELISALKNDIPIDQIKERVKAIEKFLEKTKRKKYKRPLKEMQDQIAFRIVVKYKSDVEPIAKQIIGYFSDVENKNQQQEKKSFGYEGRTIILFIPTLIVKKFKLATKFFEIQICTLFQHAWAEAEHDLGYKTDHKLSYDDERRMAWAAAQAWGADIIFDELKRRKRK